MVKGKTTKSAPVQETTSQNPMYPEMRFPSRVTDDQSLGYDEDNIDSLPGLPFMDVSGDREKDAELEFMRDQIQRLQRQQRQPQWGSESDKQGEEERLPDTTVGVFNKIKKLTISLLVENDINNEQEAFIRNLVYKKAALNDLRGDGFTLVRTQVSKIPKDIILDKEIGPAQTWMEENFNLLAIGLLSLLAFYCWH